MEVNNYEAPLESALIDCVQKFPVLYDEKVSGYKNNTVRQHIWNKISQHLNVPSKRLQIKWKLIRNGYFRNLNKFSEDKKSAGRKSKLKFYHKKLDFLRNKRTNERSTSMKDNSAHVTDFDIDNLFKNEKTETVSIKIENKEKTIPIFSSEIKTHLEQNMCLNSNNENKNIPKTNDKKMLTQNSENVQYHKTQYCRFCGVFDVEEKFFHVFNYRILLTNSNCTVAELVNNMFNKVELNFCDKLSKNICLTCLNSVIQSHSFYSKLKTTEIKLTEIVNQKQINSKYKLILPKTEDISSITNQIDEKYLENKKGIKELKKKTELSNETSNKRNNHKLCSIKRIYVCYECPENYRRFQQLKKHQSEKHFTINLCEFCNTWFDNNHILKQHIKRLHGNKKYKCLRCDFDRILSQRKLFCHYKKMHSFVNGYFKCNLCKNKEFKNRNELENHIELKHKETFVIKSSEFNNGIRKEKEYELGSIHSQNIETEIITPLQNENNDFNTDDNKLDEAMNVEFLDEFFLSQHTDNSFELTECWDTISLNFDDVKISDFSAETLSSKYLTNPDGNQKNQYQCPKCKKGFEQQFTLLEHIGTGHNFPLYLCDMCSEKFNNLIDLKMHKLIHLGKNIKERLEENLLKISQENGRNIFKCELCKKKYLEKVNFYLHNCRELKDTNKLSAVYLCNFCLKEFKSLRDLHLHKRQIHLQTKSFKCNLCSKILTTIMGYKYHMKTHVGKKELNCPYCERKFLTKLNLKFHIKAVHSIVKKHLCTLCDRNFATLDHLKKHVSSVHQKERSHLCSECGKRFSQVSHLKEHLKIHKYRKSKLQSKEITLNEAKTP